MTHSPRIAALLVAGGSGSRFGAAQPKQYLSLAGRPVIAHAAAALAAEVTWVQPVGDVAAITAALAGLDHLPPVAGGATRQDSVRNGLEALAGKPPDLVLIHDGARPMVSAIIIGAVIAALQDAEGALPCLPVVDTLKRLDGGKVGETVPRESLARAQTPQGFRYQAILAAHRKAEGVDFTDDAAVLEAAGGTVLSVPGDETNIKVTTMADLRRLEGALMETRTGSGFDVHKFGPGDGVWLCDGDIGAHFPPTDPQWRGVSSDRFLRHAYDLLRARGGALTHLDITIICERPKVGPHRAAMVARVAEIMGVATHRVSVKATTTEGLGFTGRREGIAAQAVATVKLSA